jgi:fatty acid desaturase
VCYRPTMSLPATTIRTSEPVKRQRSLWTSLPSAQFDRDPFFYIKYDTFFALIAAGVVSLLSWTGYHAPTWSSWQALLLVPAIYVMIMAHVFAHNASHGTFARPVNRVMGELCGMLVLSKFASWEIVHRRHHRYSDDPVRDPHPAIRQYWLYAWRSIFTVEEQLRQQYYDTFGDTPQTRRRESIRSAWSFVTGLSIAAMYLVILGPGLFFVVYLPAFVFAALFVVHFNWTGHNAHATDGPIAPANLDTGWFWLGNRIFFGIYFHENHHRVSAAFNPMKLALRPKGGVAEAA